MNKAQGITTSFFANLTPEGVKNYLLYAYLGKFDQRRAWDLSKLGLPATSLYGIPREAVYGNGPVGGGIAK